MTKYRCIVCNYICDDVKEGEEFSSLSKDGVCPICGAPKTEFVLSSDKAVIVDVETDPVRFF